MQINITKTIKNQLLIVGSGIAGIACSVEANKAGLDKVLITALYCKSSTRGRICC